MFTGLPGALIAFLWLSFGLVLCYCCCCCRPQEKEDSQLKQFSFWFPLLVLLLISLTAIAGCGLVYTGQGEFNDELFHTLAYVVNQSHYTVDNLHNVSTILTEAASINVDNVALPANDIERIHQLSLQLNSSADQLEQQTGENAHIIRRAIDTLRLVMIAVSGIMLLLVLLGLLSVACGLRSLIYVLVWTGWLLVAGTWIVCGAFILLDNVMGDTCLAMKEWVINPDAQTNLDDILPCVDQQTANQTLYKSKDLTNSVVTVVNQAITFVFDDTLQPGAQFYFNQSGPALPYLCSPYGPAPAYTPQACPSNEVDFQTAPANWSHFICTSTNGTCTSTGRLTQEAYHKLIETVSVANGLYVNVPFLISVENCDFVRTTFKQIITGHCPQFQRYTRWVWIGLILVSGGSMSAILLWVVYSIKCSQFMQYRRSEGKHAQPLLFGRASRAL
ncbi:hypothetical protein O6H91_01G059300 [Diphasiastrum complanatum]|nr:hypothetical protein O6H91_01G059300 [Diphasiastrum complanatum]